MFSVSDLARSAAVILEIKFCKLTVKMDIATMLVEAYDAALHWLQHPPHSAPPYCSHAPIACAAYIRLGPPPM